MSKKPFQLRLDADQLDRLARVAAAMQMSKTEIVEAGIDMRLDLLEGYQKMDRAEPKKAKGPALKVPSTVLSDLPPLKPKGRRVDHMAMTGAKPSGWDSEGNPIYRGVK